MIIESSKKIGNTTIPIYSQVPEFTESQLCNQAEKQVEFLKLIYPFLLENSWHEGGIELRPIRRSTKVKTIQSFNCWRLNEKDISEHYNFLKKGLNGKAFCVYYSVYTFNNSVDVPGKRKNKINNQNALFTTILAMDFDDITYERFQECKNIFNSLNIETIDIYTGYGIQSVILLDNNVYDTTLLNSWTNLLIRKGFPVDPAIVDQARVLRMPYSFNCKSFDPKNKRYNRDNPQAITTTDIGWTEERYSVTDVFAKIQSLPDVISADIKENQQKIMFVKALDEKICKLNNRKKDIQIIEMKHDMTEEVKNEYPMLANIENLPEPLIKLLYSTPEGLRNATMLFLVPFLKNTIGLKKAIIKDVLSVWCQRCTPKWPVEFTMTEVDRLLNYEFKGKYGRYTKEMAKVFGYIDFKQYTRSCTIKIQNRFFVDMSSMSDGVSRIYLSLIIDKANNGQRNYTFKDICGLSKFGRSALHINIKGLIEKGYLVKKRTCKKKGECFEYYLNPFISDKEGFTLIKKEIIKIMLEKLSNAEIMLYCYLYSLFSSQNVTCVGQEHLAEVIGKSRNRTSELTNSLNDKGFIIKTTIKNKNRLYCKYELNYK